MNLGNYQKTPVGASLKRIANEAASNEIAKTGRGIPAILKSIKGSLVTVTFQVSGSQTYHDIQVPLACSEWVRPSFQPGDKGYCIPSDYYLGGMSGLGGGQATTVPRGNLSNLAWHPVGNADFQTEDPNVTTIYGLNGATIKDKAGTAQIKVSPGQIQFIVGDTIITLNGSSITMNTGTIYEDAPSIYLNGAIYQGTGTFGGLATIQSLKVNIDAAIGTISSYVGHEHGGVTTGGGITAPPTAGT